MSDHKKENIFYYAPEIDPNVAQSITWRSDIFSLGMY